MTGKRWALVVASVVLVVVAAFLVLFYLQYQSRAELRKRKLPFAEVVVLAVAEAEAELQQKGFIATSSAVRAACGPDTCADVLKFSIGNDGRVEAILSGKRQRELEGKLLILVPAVSNGAVRWNCATSAPKQYVPAPGDRLPGLWPVNVDYCTQIQ